MSAVAERRRLAAIGRDLLALEGPPAKRRGARLRAAIDGLAAEPLTMADLAAVPAWARLPRPAQERLAHEAALASISATLARSIDGALLGGHASIAGEDAVERALLAPPEAAAARSLPPVPPEGLAARGFALLAATLPGRLRSLVSWAPREAGDPPRERASACVQAALAAAA